MTNFAKVLELLADAGVRFVVVGGYAAMLQGSAYVTQGLDICYERTPDNILRLTAALANLNPRLRGAPDGLPLVFDERTLNQGMNFTLATDLVDVDLLGELSGVGRYQELDRDANDMELYGRKYRVASLDTLIRSKRAAGRPKDLNLLPELEALQELKMRHKPEKKT
jgi:predicted nucleotidyltransferase